MNAYEILGAVSPVAPQAAQALVKSPSAPSMDTRRVMTEVALPAAVGAVLAVMRYKKHKVLAAISGAAIGASIMPIVKDASVIPGENRKTALLHLGVIGAAVYGSLRYRKHPALGYVGAGVAAGLVAQYGIKPRL